MKYDHSEGQ